MKQSSRDVTPILQRNWVIACFGSHVNLYLFSLINEDMWTVRTVQRSYDGLFRTEAEGSYPDFLPNFSPTVSLQVSVLLNTVEPLPTTAISEDRKKSGRWREVAVVEGFKQESMHGLSAK